MNSSIIYDVAVILLLVLILILSTRIPIAMILSPVKGLDLNEISARVMKDKLHSLIYELYRKKRGKCGAGWIYLFKDNHIDDNNVYKIGRTGKLVSKRLKQWSSKCKHKLTLLAKWKVNRHELAESLIHSELKLNKKWYGQYNCTTCKSNHNEFFKGSLNELCSVVQFWVEFLNSNRDK